MNTAGVAVTLAVFAMLCLQGTSAHTTKWMKALGQYLNNPAICRDPIENTAHSHARVNFNLCTKLDSLDLVPYFACFQNASHAALVMNRQSFT